MFVRASSSSDVRGCEIGARMLLARVAEESEEAALPFEGKYEVAGADEALGAVDVSSGTFFSSTAENLADRVF